ncbi:MAG TPA: hypothetical protein VLM91_03780 [Candidatus Methylomirabilis sp.]|nr:hypothetical protein [Candidatus Methylomirabilis sp.]
MKTLRTALGAMQLKRAYSRCDACRRGFCPRDRVLGVEDTSLSPAVTRMVGTAAVLVSFAESSELLAALAGLAVEAKQVERTAAALGREMAVDERQRVLPAGAAEIVPTKYLGMDGTGVPMRKEEVADRLGKQADGAAKTREVKVCTVWSVEGRDAAGVPVRDAGTVSYSAVIESAAARDTDATGSAYAQPVDRKPCRRGFDPAGQQAVLGDGAPWIWNIAGEAFLAAIQIVDRFHATEHLSGMAKVLYGAPSDLGDAWATTRHADLDAGHLHQIVAALAVQEVGRFVVRALADSQWCGHLDLEATGVTFRAPVCHVGSGLRQKVLKRRSRQLWRILVWPLQDMGNPIPGALRVDRMKQDSLVGGARSLL